MKALLFWRRLPMCAVALSLVTASGIGHAQTPNTETPPVVVGTGPQYVPGELLIQFRSGVTDAQEQDARNRVGAVRVERIRAAQPAQRALARVAEGQLERAALRGWLSVPAAIRILQAHPAVAFAEPNWIYTHQATSNDPYYTNGSLWGMRGNFGSQADTAWAASPEGHTGSKSVYIGVIDEGIQVDHPDLKSNIWINPYERKDGVDNDGNGYKDDINGWDFVNNDSTVYDGGKRGTQDKHGTHVAGTIGAQGGNGTGVVGVNWNVTLISTKFLGSFGGTTTNAIKAVDYFTNLKSKQGLNIVATNNSWGGGGYSQALYDAIERANAAGILFIAAAGNGGSDSVGDNIDATLSYPASYNNANIIAVSAINSSGGLASFSNYGATSVHVGAPGVGIYSTLPSNTYGSYSGTSMATPHVTGAAALYASTHPIRAATAIIPGESPSEYAQRIKTAILDAARATSTDSLPGKTVTGGRLNVSGF